MSRIPGIRTLPMSLLVLSQVLACLLAGPAQATGVPEATAQQRGDPRQENPTEQDATPQQAGDPEPDAAPQEEPVIAAHEATEDAKPKRLQFSADVRVRLNSASTSDEGGTLTDNGEARLRVRAGLAWVISRQLDFKTRFAGTISSDGNDFGFEVDSSPPTSTGLEPGQATLDEIYLKWAPGRRFTLYGGRFQTQFQLQGVFPKSLDKKDSPNMSITWTDGLHLFFRGKTGWSSHFIAQHNDEDGPSNILREPLDFTDDDSRVSYFLNVRNDRRFGPLVQRALDITYLPAALLKDGVPNGRLEDYWAALTRWSLEWHLGEGTRSIIAGGGIGYASETPTDFAVGLPGLEETDGLAWQAQVSLMNFMPGHSIGLNVGVVGAGWLISPQFRNNEELAEIRYRKLMRRGGLLEIRVRYREQIDAEIGDPTPDTEWDGYVRFTRSF